MRHIAILVPDGQTSLTTIACITGAYEIFTCANAYNAKIGSGNTYKIELVGVKGLTHFEQGMLTVRPHSVIDNVKKTDLIIVPSLARNFEEALHGNAGIADWITLQYKNGAEVASMCTGAFMLAAAGLLNGRNCSTHWSAADDFKRKFPKVKLHAEKLITDEHGIYTNGGGYSFLNLAIYLVEKYYDRQTAIYCSKIFQIEMDRHSQSEFIIFKGQKQHDDEVIRHAQAYIENNVHNKFSVEELSSQFAIGRRHFDRRFIKATGNTPLEYSQRVKIEAAKRAFETTRRTINEVMFDVGYADVKSFRDVFRKITGITPLEYRNKYNRDVAIG